MVDDGAFGQQQDLVDGCEDPEAGLVDAEDDGTASAGSDGLEPLHHVERQRAVQCRSGLVKVEHGGILE